jgi:glucose 1-dehydrogenase
VFFDRSCLENQSALVTGGDSGIGRAIAIGLAKAGADVAINFHSDKAAAEDVRREIEPLGRKALAIQADVSREDEVERMFAEAVACFGALHILVSNAGLQRDARICEMTLMEWNDVIGVNLTGQFLCMRAAAREFRKREADASGGCGKIICMSSVHERIPWAGHANYAASKGGVNMLMRTFAQELVPHRIRVNAIAPGAIRTPINRAAWATPEAYARLMKLIPYGRIGEPEDVANAAVWLASDASDHVTGATLFIDGGMTLYPDFASGG